MNKRGLTFYIISMLLVAAIGGTIFTILLVEGLIQ
jgi:hypothetical protein